MSASTTLLTDMATIVALTPTAASTAAAIAAAGPIMDLPGNLKLAQAKLQEAKLLLVACDVDVDSGDPIQTTLTNVLAALV